MTHTTITATVLEPREINGVAYDRQAGGAPCPGGDCTVAKARVTRTLPWEHGLRVRYHKCQGCETKFSSVEEHHQPAPVAAVGFRGDPGHPLRRA